MLVSIFQLSIEARCSAPRSLRRPSQMADNIFTCFPVSVALKEPNDPKHLTCELSGVSLRRMLGEAAAAVGSKRPPAAD